MCIGKADTHLVLTPSKLSTVFVGLYTLDFSFQFCQRRNNDTRSIEHDPIDRRGDPDSAGRLGNAEEDEEAEGHHRKAQGGLMIDIRHILGEAQKTIKDNTPAILAGMGIAGVITTSYLAVRATFRATQVIVEDEFKSGTAATPRKRLEERAKLTWKLYIPTAISGAITIGAIAGATRIGSRRATALASAYSLSERAFSEYRGKVAEKFGEGKERALRDELAQDRVNNNPPKDVVIATGQVLCCEAFTGRYFNCDMETLRRAENTINAKMVHSMYAYLDDFYDIVGLERTTMSDRIGWEVDRMLELRYSAVLHNGRPCISFEYNYTKAF